jgi:hypothetical protein
MDAESEVGGAFVLDVDPDGGTRLDLECYSRSDLEALVFEMRARAWVVALDDNSAWAEGVWNDESLAYSRRVGYKKDKAERGWLGALLTKAVHVVADEVTLELPVMMVCDAVAMRAPRGIGERHNPPLFDTAGAFRDELASALGAGAHLLGLFIDTRSTVPYASSRVLYAALGASREATRAASGAFHVRSLTAASDWSRMYELSENSISADDVQRQFASRHLFRVSSDSGDVYFLCGARHAFPDTLRVIGSAATYEWCSPSNAQSVLRALVEHVGTLDYVSTSIAISVVPTDNSCGAEVAAIHACFKLTAWAHAGFALSHLAYLGDRLHCVLSRPRAVPV